MKKTTTKRRGLAILLSIAMVMTFIPTMTFAAEPGFPDVKGHWAETAIEKWADYGVLKGDDKGFRPEDSITRAEVATVIDNLMDFQVAAQNNFSDVSSSDWYADAILKANAAGVMSGDDAGRAAPNNKITKEQAALMLARAFAVEANNGNGTKFTDAGEISSWAQSLVYGMETAGYVNGANGKFNPKANIKRAELVTMIDNAVKNYVNTAETAEAINPGLTVVSAPNAVIKGQTVTGNLIIAEGVGNGDFTLDGTTVKGNVIVRGGGANSVKLTGGSTVTGTVIIEKVGSDVRVTTKDNNGVALSSVEVAGGSVVLDGAFGNVVIVGDVKVDVAAGSKVTGIKVEATASVAIEKGATVTNLTVDKAAGGSTVAVAEGAKITTLTMEAKTEVDNKGTIEKAEAKSDGIVITGTPPTKTEVTEGVKPPTDGKGQSLPGTETVKPPVVSGGGGGGGGADQVPTPTMSITKVEVGSTTVSPADGAYTIPASATKDNTKITVAVGNLASSNIDYTATLKIEKGASKLAEATATAERAAVELLNGKAVSISNLADIVAKSKSPSGGYWDGNSWVPVTGDQTETALETIINKMFTEMNPGDSYKVTVTLKAAGGSAQTLAFTLTKAQS